MEKNAMLQTRDLSMLPRQGLFCALIAVGAWIRVPVPFGDYFTLQLFFVLLSGLLLGAKGGAGATAVYVLLGLIGVPIFAGGGGIGYVLQPSFGYLLGFIAAAFVVGKYRGKNNFFSVLGICLLATAICYGIGLFYKYWILRLYVQQPVPFWLLLASCFPVDLPGDMFLCVVCALVQSRLKTALGRGE